LLSGSKNIRFDEFVSLLLGFGFELKRTRGSHHVFKHPSVPKPFPIQPKQNGQAKAYQLQQFLKLVEQYELSLDDSEDA
jgi:predicted RNA binding protein YcfA (HicA-like mRNA interferase family)